MTRPRWHSDHALLAAVAAYIAGIEMEETRQLVQGGHLDRDAGLRHVRVLRVIAADWRAVAALEPEPEHIRDGDRGGAWPHERRAALARAAEGARRRADLSAGDVETVGIADAVDTLVWWETAQPRARFYADFNIRARAEAALRRAPTLFPMGEAA